MSTYFHIDSTWRDRTLYPNPAEFLIPIEVAKGWRTPNRTVQAVRPHNKMQVTNMSHSVRLLNLSIPFNFGGDIGTTFVDTNPFIYVTMQSTSYYKDMKLINTIENGNIVNEVLDASGNITKVSLKDAIFVAYCDKLQGGDTSSWIQYKCNMIQTYRIDQQDAISFRVFGADGKTLTIIDTQPPTAINKARQVNALFELTPYVREEAYDNHFVTLYNSNA